MNETGYLHPAYPLALGYGSPYPLPRSGGWLLLREIAGTALRDAMGCYPLFCCRDWRGLRDDLEELAGVAVALSAVTDPFGGYDVDLLRACFPDLVRPFKEHYVIDLTRPIEQGWHEHHRRNERRGRKNVEVELLSDVSLANHDWLELYSVLTRKHDVRGIAAFSNQSLTQQLAVPGSVVFRASRNGATVGMTVWYVQGCVGYYHLAAYTDEGYAQRASFALFSTAIRHFADRGLQWLDLGAAAGLQDDPNSGLARFKRGWATGTLPTYLCGRVFDIAQYTRLRETTGTVASTYFPAYRDTAART